MDAIELEYVKYLCIEKLLVPFEGYALKLPNGDCKAYPDPATGKAPWTIGYGSTHHPDGTPVKKGEVWTQSYAKLVKREVLHSFVLSILELCPVLNEENPNRLAAVASLAYNIGLGNFKGSTLCRLINKKQWKDCYLEFTKWNRANGKVMQGLVNRRKAEAELFMQED